MNVLVAVGDIGGQRALIPLLKDIVLAGHQVFLSDHRVILDEIASVFPFIRVVNLSVDSVVSFIKTNQIEAYLFSTSVKDSYAISMAEKARQLGLKTICILDNWMNYKGRLEIAANQFHFPDIYCVMDELAKTEAIKAGIPEDTIKVIGIQAIQSLDDTIHSISVNHTPEEKKTLLFINEPASKDQGVDDTNPLFRGYSEYQVLKDLFIHHKNFFKDFKVIICPHPRDDRKKLEVFISQMVPEIDISLSSEKNNITLLPTCSGVIGMASIFLFYSWLYNVPTLSYQPGLRLDDLATLKKREGVLFLTETVQLEAHLQLFAREVSEFNFVVEKKRKLFYEYVKPYHTIQSLLNGCSRS